MTETKRGKKNMVKIAIDGPAGAGKSTIARAVAQQMGYIYIDTGAMYRALAWKAIGLGIRISKEPARVCAFLPDTRLEVGYRDGEQYILIDGQDVSQAIRTPEVSAGSSEIAVIPEVRAWLLDFQRQLAEKNNCIMDGRDIGTKVLPDANVKIFLTASPEDRARRRYDELKLRGEDVSYNQVLMDMIARDKNDSERAASPLRQAEDAVRVDTTGNTLEQSIAQIRQLIEKLK